MNFANLEKVEVLGLPGVEGELRGVDMGVEGVGEGLGGCMHFLWHLGFTPCCMIVHTCGFSSYLINGTKWHFILEVRCKSQSKQVQLGSVQWEGIPWKRSCLHVGWPQKEFLDITRNSFRAISQHYRDQYSTHITLPSCLWPGCSVSPRNLWPHGSSLVLFPDLN